MSARGVGRRVRRGVLVAVLLLAAACDNGEMMPQTTGGAGTGGSSTPWTCQQIRMCAFECLSDQCVQTCAAKGTADAQTTFEALRACTAQACTPVTDVNCACAEQCLDGGGCFAEVAACVGAAPGDLICDSELCH